MSHFIDRRPDGKNKSAVNRQRFIRRFKSQIKQAVSNAIAGRSITDIESGEKVTIPAKDTIEHSFQHDKGGRHESVHPGNRDFVKGDKIKRPQEGEGGGDGSQASNSGEGTDDFGFEISREELLEIFFEDLELPNLIRKKINKAEAFKWVHAGYTTVGIPANINIIRSLRGAIARRNAIGGSYQRKIDKKSAELDELLQITIKEDDRVIQLKHDIETLKNRQRALPFIDTFDLRYNNRVKQPAPITQAVMFCIMDVSGSMDEAKKDVAKRFFILLYLFLTRTYKHIDVVFIRHHTSAKEVDEDEFFYSRETGGTVVSSALDLMCKIVRERYSNTEWNIYAAQASDGDNWNNDSPRCRDILLNEIIPVAQYYAYVEIMPRHHQSLWEAYQCIDETCANFAMRHIEDVKDIYPVFRELFKRELA